jgi:hypothetical protein
MNFRADRVAGPLPPPVLPPGVGALLEVPVFVGGVVLSPFFPELEHAATEVARPTASTTHAPRFKFALDINPRGNNFSASLPFQNGSRIAECDRTRVRNSRRFG